MTGGGGGGAAEGAGIWRGRDDLVGSTFETFDRTLLKVFKCAGTPPPPPPPPYMSATGATGPVGANRLGDVALDPFELMLVGGSQILWFWSAAAVIMDEPVSSSADPWSKMSIDTEALPIPWLLLVLPSFSTGCCCCSCGCCCCCCPFVYRKSFKN